MFFAVKMCENIFGQPEAEHLVLGGHFALHFIKELNYQSPLCNFIVRKKHSIAFRSGMMRGARRHHSFVKILISEDEIMKSTQWVCFF